MKVIDIFSNKNTRIHLSPSVVTIGAFDGLHKAHQELMKETLLYSKTHHLKSGVVSFTPNPVEVIKNTVMVPLLSDSSKQQKIEEMGFDYYFIIHFDLDIQMLSPFLFLQKLLYEQNVKHIFVGYDFTFGSLGLGTAKDIESLSNHLLSVDILEEMKMEFNSIPLKVSSTSIRSFLKEGKMKEASRELGYDYFIEGMVQNGKQIGRTIDFPTINFKVAQVKLLKPGVYVTYVLIDEIKYPAMTNIGHNSKFNYNEEVTMETNILDFHSSLYNQTLKVYFISYIREELEFNSLEELKHQLIQDEEKVRDYFK